jgi:general secretion pathway protein D
MARNKWRGWRAAAWASVAGVCLAGTAVVRAQEGAGHPVLDASRSAVARREASLERARQQSLQGDRLHSDKDYAGAVEAYRGAFLQAPDVPAAQTFRVETFAKYEASMREEARRLAAGGRLPQGKAMVRRFFDDARDAGLPPAAVGEETRRLMADLDDGETYEPANTEELVRRKEEVRRLFAFADGAAQTGQFDAATEAYANILALDPTNSSARRGIEAVDRMVNAYNRAARDQTRATMLAQVTAAWESPVPRFGLEELGTADLAPAPAADGGSVREKLRSIVFPEVQLAETPLQEVVLYLAARSRELDTASPAGARGVNVLIGTEDAGVAATPVSLQLRNAPLGTVLDYVAQLARLKVRVDEFAVKLVPLSSPDSDAMITKTYKVPPNFINAGGAGAGDAGGAADPFADVAGGAATTLQKKLTAEEFLKMNGVSFAPGASARFVSATSSLLVRNTQDQLDLVEAMIESSFGSVAKLLRIDVKTLEISETDLKELGFDWLLGQFNIPGSERVFGSGGTRGNTAAGPLNPADEFPFVAPGSPNPVGTFPVTAGNRSGDQTGFADTIDAAINRDVSLGGNGTSSKAPGIFSLAGVFTDPQFQMVIRAIDQKAAEDLMTMNSVVTRAGQVAVLKSVREFIYPTEYDPPEMPQTVGQVQIGNVINTGFDSFAPITPAHPTAFQTRELGSIVEVEAAIGADNYTVDLDVKPEVTRFDGFINYGSPIEQTQTAPNGQPYVAQRVENPILMPVFRVLRNDVRVSVYSGQTAVIGGLYEAKRQGIDDKTPVLGDAPFVGKLFRSTVDRSQRKAVIFFVTVNIIDPSGGVVKGPAATTASL